MMIRTFSIAATALCVTLTCVAAGRASDLPPDSVPGALNPNVTQSNLATTVCVPNWTATVRPPASYTNKLKAQQMREFGMTEKLSDREEDHRVPLACGGNPTSPQNLYPELWVGRYGAHAKDKVEAEEHRRLCRGEITLAQCQAIFLGDWTKEYDRLYGTQPVQASAH